MRRIKLLEQDWPEADRALLAQLTAQGGVLDESGPLSHLRPGLAGVPCDLLWPMAGLAQP
jgi:hypothetical protein